jgi:inner membrane protein
MQALGAASKRKTIHQTDQEHIMGFLFDSSPYWLWLSAGLLLIAAETVLPGVFLLWIGFAAIATGLFVWVLPLTFTFQLVLFAILGLVAILFGRKIQANQKLATTDAPFLNERGRSLVGKTFLLETAITNGAGSVRIGDSVWRVSGANAPQGTSVKVTDIDGSTLRVESV